MNPMRCSLLALAVLLLPRPAAAESPVVFGLSLRGGLNHLGGDFGAEGAMEATKDS